MLLNGNLYYSWSGEPSVVCKKNVPIYNNVTQTAAKSIAQRFKSNKNVKSALISGIQWDVMMDYVNNSEDGLGGKFNVTVFDEDRHIGFLHYSGFNEKDKVKNIYDLEGNAAEWVAETVITGDTYIDPSMRRRTTE